MMFVKYFVKQRQMMKIENIITYRYIHIQELMTD